MREITIPGGHRVQLREEDGEQPHVSFVHGDDGYVHHPAQSEVLIELVRTILGADEFVVLGAEDSVLTVHREVLEEVYLRGYLTGDGDTRVTESELRVGPDWFVAARDLAIAEAIERSVGVDACPDVPGTVGGGDVEGPGA
jgi:hypothetical protein